MRLSLLAALSLTAPVSAQLTYDAGTPGNPPVAPSPVTQGWFEAISGTVTVGDVSPDPSFPYNAWQITDEGPGEGTYAHSAWVGNDWEAYLTLRMMGGSAHVVIDTGDLITNSLFEIELELSGSDVLVHRPFGGPIVCAGGGIGYHTYRFTIANYVSLFWFDGEYRGDIDESQWGLVEYGSGLRFGTGDGLGRVRVNHASIGPSDSHFVQTSAVCFPAVPNSTGDYGGIRIVGSDIVANDDLTLIASRLPPEPNIGYFIMGTGTNTFTPPGSAGPICVAPGIQRFLPPVNNTTQLDGGFARSVGTTGPVSGAITAGSTWGFQAWHRDGTHPSNLTYGRRVTFQ